MKLAFIALLPCAAAAQSLTLDVPVPASSYVPVGPVRLSRSDTNGDLSVTLTADGGEFDITGPGDGTWTNPAMAVIPNGSNEVDVWVRGPETGATISAQAAGYSTALATLPATPYLFQDDFELAGLTLDGTPAGRWGSVNNPESSSLNSITLTAQAAHRGAQGVRFIDGDVTAADHFSIFLGQALFMWSGPLFFRTWIDVLSASPTDGTDFFQIIKLEEPTFSTGQFAIAYDPQIQGVGCDVWATPAYIANAAGPGSVPIGQWKLLEASYVGRGTPDASYELRVDGVVVNSVEHADFEAVNGGINFGAFFDEYGIGQLTVDYDDMRLSNKPLAEALSMVVPDAGVGCEEVGVFLIDPYGNRAAAPYGFNVSLSGAAFFSDATCSTPLALGLAFAEGATAGTAAYARFDDAGTYALTASNVDFLSSSTTLQVVPSVPTAAHDAGPGVETGDAGGGGEQPQANRALFLVSCGCNAAGQSAALALLVLLQRSRRSRDR